MRNKGTRIKEIIIQHVLNNKREYIIVSLLFIIGIFLGVMFINNVQEEQKTEIQTYLNNFISKMKETENLDYISLLKTSISQNVLFAVIIWFFGTTVIRFTSSFWFSYLSRILLRIYNIYLYIDNGNVKGIKFCIYKFIITKLFVNTSNTSLSCKWI